MRAKNYCYALGMFVYKESEDREDKKKLLDV